jgi:NAD(P)-dependent dehydrogenase (short-subunit alcohol dehydrogenase family)
MTAAHKRLGGLQVLLTGAGAPISCDVVRLLAAEGAAVTAADEGEPVLARLRRDLGLYRMSVNTALVDLQSYTEMRLFAENLQGLGKLPHLIVCCCDGKACPAHLAVAVLQPSLVVHALPIARWRLLRAITALSIPSLGQLLGQQQQRDMLALQARRRRVSIAGHPFSVSRCAHAPEPEPRAPTPAPAPLPAAPPPPAPHGLRLVSFSVPVGDRGSPIPPPHHRPWRHGVETAS